jgi:hypothetical protein
MTQTEFVKKSGLDISLGTFNKVANCKRTVTLTTESKILNALNKAFGGKYSYKDVFPNGNGKKDEE